MRQTAFGNCCEKKVCANQCRAKAKVRDNAQAESFFSGFKAELIEDGVYEDLDQARSEIFSYIEGYYNRVRLHSGLGYKSPIEFEMELHTKNEGNKRRFFV